MASLVLLPLLLSLITLSAGFPGEKTPGIVRSEHEMRWLYDEWVLAHDKSYSSASEKDKRFEIFKENLLFIDNHNRPGNNNNYTLGLNKFADLTDEEFCDLYLEPPLNLSHAPAAHVSTLHRPQKGLFLPNDVEWILEGAVTAVKDQGVCRGSRAFAAVAAIEGLNKIMLGKRPLNFSSQDLIDCDMRSQGCNGGLITNSYQYVVDNGGIDCDNHYRYRGVAGACRPDRKRIISISGYRSVERRNRHALQAAVARQPVSVFVEASGRHFRFYKTGLFSGPCGTAGNHFLTVIGYGLYPPSLTPHWHLKNSWGLGWGHYGTIYMRRDVDGSGLCGIHEFAHYPYVNKLGGKESEGDPDGEYQ